MDKLIDFTLCAGATTLELIIILIGLALIQLIVYRTTGISIFNKFTKLMFKADKYMTAKFN